MQLDGITGPVTSEVGSKMDTRIENFLISLGKAFVLRSYGWKRRKRRYYTQFFVEWRDPESRLWYSQATAYELVKLRGRHLVR